MPPEQLELIRSVFRGCIRTVRKKHACTPVRCHRTGPRAFTAHRSGVSQDRAASPRADSKYAEHPRCTASLGMY